MSDRLMESLDISSEGLNQQGYLLTNEGQTIVLYFNEHGDNHRFSIYKNDWNKTTKQIEKKLQDKEFPPPII